MATVQGDKGAETGDPSEICWNWETTFRVMAQRRLQRQVGGYYKKRDNITALMVLAVTIWLVLLALASVEAVSSEDSVGVVLVMLFMLWGFRKLILSSRLIAIWFFLGWAIMFLATGQFLGIFYMNEDTAQVESEDVRMWRAATWIGIFVMTGLTVLMSFLHGVVYPWAVRTGRVSTVGWFRVRRGAVDNELVYLSRAWSPLQMFKKVELMRANYTGGVDDEGRPHGVGQWEELSYHGEQLRGMWRHGIPVAPFSSSEKGSGYAFRATRVGVIYNRDEPGGLNTTRFSPRRDERGAGWGVAHVEASVSGMFFKHLPQVTWVEPPAHETGRGALWALSYLVSPIDALSKAKDADRVTVVANPAARSVSVTSLRDAKKTPVGTAPATMVRVSLAPRVLSGNPSVCSNGAGAGDSLVAPFFHTAQEDKDDGDKNDEEDKGHEAPAHGADAASGGKDEEEGGVSSEEEGQALLRRRVDRLLGINNQVLERLSLLQLDDWEHNTRPTLEAIVFIPGFNTPCEPAVAQFSQLLALGEFPPTMIPLVFSWPAGQILTYHWAQSRGAQCSGTREDFAGVLEDLVRAGIDKVHIMAHSMGARVLMNAVQAFEGVVAREATQGTAAAAGLVELQTVTFLNPDYELDSFVANGGGFDTLRKFCRVITLYGDLNDGALLSAWIFNNFRESMGRSIYSHRRAAAGNGGDGDSGSGSGGGAAGEGDEEEGQSERGEDVEGDGPVEDWQSTSRNFRLVNRLLTGRHRAGKPSAGGGGGGSDDDDDDDGLGVAGTVTWAEEARQGHVHRHASTLYGGRRRSGGKSKQAWDMEVLDLDIIDTSFLEHNIHAIRHSFFNINRVIVEDLRELLVNKRRARTRPGTIHKEGNVFSFVLAPSIVKNK